MTGGPSRPGDPQRKLAAGERIIGPIRLLLQYGEDASVLEKTAAAALLYTAPQEEAWTKLRAEKSSGQILEEICKVGREEIIFSDIMNYIDRFEEIFRTGNRVPGAMYHL